MASHVHTFLKTVSWRTLASTDTFLIGFVITGHVGAAASIAGIEVATKFLLYYLHERAWVHLPRIALKLIGKDNGTTPVTVDSRGGNIPNPQRTDG